MLLILVTCEGKQVFKKGNKFNFATAVDIKFHVWVVGRFFFIKGVPRPTTTPLMIYVLQSKVRNKILSKKIDTYFLDI